MIDTQKILQDLADEIVKRMKAKIISNGNNSSGNLVNNIFGKATKNEIAVTMPFYGKFVDEGTSGTEKGGGKDGNLPSNPERKMPIKKGSNGWELLPGINSWAAAKSIHRYGTKPYPFIFVFEEVVLEYKDKLQISLGIKIGTEIGRYLKQSVI